jgi:hypothetical protein
MTVEVARAVRCEHGTVTVSAILERAVADPVDGGAREEVVGGSIVDRAGVSEGWGHDAGRQHGGRQTDASPAGVSSECHLHLPSWLVLRAPPVRRLHTNEPGEDPFPCLGGVLGE